MTVARPSLAPARETTAIDVRDLFRVHSTPEGDAAALQGLSLRVREREVLTVLGPSGAGKTTFLRILAGLDRPSAGTARVFGTDVGKLRGRALAAYRSQTLGYLDQHYSRALAPELSARELAAIRLGLAGVPRRERLARGEELLERVGLLHKAEARRYELSGGEQQRVAVCAALAHHPRLFLADEPTGELDAENAQLVYGLLGSLSREHGCTTVIVSHDPGSAAISDRTVHIRDGRVSEESTRTAGDGDVIVVGRGGWLRLPEEFLRRAGIGARAQARVEPGRIVVAPAGSVETPEDGQSRPAVAGGARRVRALAREDGAVAEVRAVSKAYGEGETATAVLTDLTASFRAARLYAITGPSGSGKTTFLHLLAGLELPDAGDVIVLGTSVPALDRSQRAELRRSRLGVVAQETGLIPFLSARENVELALALRGDVSSESSERALESLATVGLSERSAQRVSRLSAGERVRVAIARTLAARPALLLADEPTARVDQANALALATLLSRVAAEWRMAVLCATHDPLVVEQADEELMLAPIGERRDPSGEVR